MSTGSKASNDEYVTIVSERVLCTTIIIYYQITVFGEVPVHDHIDSLIIMPGVSTKTRQKIGESSRFHKKRAQKLQLHVHLLTLVKCVRFSVKKVRVKCHT